MSDAFITDLRNLHSSMPNNAEVVSITFKKNKLKFDPKVLDYSELFGDVENEGFNIAYEFVEMLNEIPVSCLNDVCANIVFAGGLWRIKGMQNYFKKKVARLLE